MTNWCENSLNITGPSDVIDEFVKIARIVKPIPCDINNKINIQEDEEVLNFNSLYPIPSNIIDSKKSYEWELKNWWCKWGAYDSKIYENSDNEVEYHFLTAWSPPKNFLIKISRDFPELKFRLEYEEPLMGFSGTIMVRKGKIVDESFEQ